jgi:thiamine-phosphate pyrophosphorylase
MHRRLNLAVYLVTDSDLCGGLGIAETVRLAVAGGVTMVQLRDPRASTRRLVEEARTLIGILRPLGVPLLINDRVDVALAAGADGVHLGQDDMRPRDARALFGDDAIIGLSVGNLDEFTASQDDLADADYLGTGPFAVTRTKGDAGDAIGAQGLRAVRAATNRPIVAIGGIDAGNAAEAIAAGADGVAVVSAICGADSPDRAARAIADAVIAGRRR